MSSIRPLASGFPAYTEGDWRAQAKKRRADDRDSRGTSNDIERALPPGARGARPVVGRPPAEPWRIVERIDSGDTAEAASLAMIAIAGGATGLEFALPASVHPLARCVEGDPTSLARSLAALPEGLHLRIDAGAPSPVAIDPFLQLARTHSCELVWSFDPVVSAALQGGAPEDDRGLRQAAAAFDAHGVPGQLLVADGRSWHAGGATEEQELGIALATYASHARALGSADRIGIALAVDSDQFRSIAKLRAMRLLVARIVEVAGLTPPPLKVHAETAWRSLSIRDPDMNILRATAAAFAAVVGGADSIAVIPFDAATAANSAPARRLSRNLQIILAEEAHVGRVADPGAGSGVMESLTASFAEAAWKRFQSIEAEGGIIAAIAEGALLREVAEARESRLARVARADIKLVGVNAFRGEATTATVKRAPVKRTGPLTFKRLSSPFEDES